MTSKRLKAYLYLLVATIMWGIASPVIKFTLDGIGPFPFLAYRFAIAGVFSVISLIVMKPKMPKNPSSYLALGVYGFVAIPLALGLLFHGLEKSTVLELGLIGAMGPLAVAVGGAIFLNEKIENNERIGMLLAFLGTMATIFGPIFTGDELLQISGNILIVLFLIADSAGVLMAKRLTKKHFDPLTMTNFAFIIGAVVMIPYTIYLTGANEFFSQIMSLELKYHLGVWYMAIISGSIAYFLFVKGEELIEAGEAGLFFYLHPVISFPLAIIWLGEKITISFLAGAVLIATGVIIAEYRPGKRNRKFLFFNKLH